MLFLLLEAWVSIYPVKEAFHGPPATLKLQESLDSTLKKQRLQNGCLWGIMYTQWHTPVDCWLSLHKCVSCHVTLPEPGPRMFPPATKCPSHQCSTLNQPLIWFLSWQVPFVCLEMPHPQNHVGCTFAPGFAGYTAAFEVVLAYIVCAVCQSFFWVRFHCTNTLQFDFPLWIGRQFVSTPYLISRRKGAIGIPIEGFPLTYILLVSFSKTPRRS